MAVTSRACRGVQTHHEVSCHVFVLTWIVTVTLLTVATLHGEAQRHGAGVWADLPDPARRSAAAASGMSAREAWAAPSTASKPPAAGKNASVRSDTNTAHARHGDDKSATRPTREAPSIDSVNELAKRLKSAHHRDAARFYLLMALIHRGRAR
jgi:hypothetical protein